jgi:hypothetical protein
MIKILVLSICMLLPVGVLFSTDVAPGNRQPSCPSAEYLAQAVNHIRTAQACFDADDGHGINNAMRKVDLLLDVHTQYNAQQGLANPAPLQAVIDARDAFLNGPPTNLDL